MMFLVRGLLLLRESLLKLFIKFFEAIQDPETGKIKAITPNHLKLVVATLFFLFVVVIAGYKVLSGQITFSDNTNIEQSIKQSDENQDQDQDFSDIVKP